MELLRLPYKVLREIFLISSDPVRLFGISSFIRQSFGNINFKRDWLLRRGIEWIKKSQKESKYCELYSPDILDLFRAGKKDEMIKFILWNNEGHFHYR